MIAARAREAMSFRGKRPEHCPQHLEEVSVALASSIYFSVDMAVLWR